MPFCVRISYPTGVRVMFALGTIRQKFKEPVASCFQPPALLLQYGRVNGYSNRKLRERLGGSRSVPMEAGNGSVPRRIWTKGRRWPL